MSTWESPEMTAILDGLAGLTAAERMRFWEMLLAGPDNALKEAARAHGWTPADLEARAAPCLAERRARLN